MADHPTKFFQIYGVKPDLPLVFALCMAIVKGKKAGAFMGFLNGLLEDIIFGRFVGLNTIAKTVTGYILGYSSQNVYKGPAIITMGLVFISSIIYNFLFIFLGYLTKELSPSWYSFLAVTMPSSLLNMLVSPFIYLMVSRMERFFDYYFDIKY